MKKVKLVLFGLIGLIGFAGATEMLASKQTGTVYHKLGTDDYEPVELADKTTEWNCDNQPNIVCYYTLRENATAPYTDEDFNEGPRIGNFYHIQ